MPITAGIKARVDSVKYPYIGENRNNRRVVLFEKSHYGTVLATSGDQFPVGTYGYWCESEYDPIESILLTNV